MKIDDDFEFKIARLELHPDDFLIVRAKECLPRETIVRIHEVAHKALGHRKCLVLDGGLDLAVLSPAPTDEALVGKTDDELRDMFERGEISRNQLRRAKGLQAIEPGPVS